MAWGPFGIFAIAYFATRPDSGEPMPESNLAMHILWAVIVGLAFVVVGLLIAIQVY